MAERHLTGNTSDIRRETPNPTWQRGKTCFIPKIEIAYGMDSRPHLLRQSDSYEVEYRFRRADDSYAVVLDRAYLVYDETGQPTPRNRCHHRPE